MQAMPIDLSKFTFIDLGAGKGRALLMASDYLFQKIIGVEFMPELHHARRKISPSIQTTAGNAGNAGKSNRCARMRGTFSFL